MKDVFEQMGSSAKLPDITLWFMDFLDTLAIYWYIPVGIIAIIVAAIVVIILVLGPEIAAVIAGSAAIDSTVSALIAVVFNGIRSIL